MSEMKIHYKEDRIVIECHCGHTLHLHSCWGRKDVHMRIKLRCGHIFDGVVKRDMKNYPLTPFEKVMKQMEMGI